MVEKKYGYYFVNMIILLVSITYFVIEYSDIEVLLFTFDYKKYIMIFFTVVVVHMIKLLRLYLAFYGLDIEFNTHLKIYSKVTPVSIILPFKLGELFRMYCYGRQVKSIIRGGIIILLDRFMDTLALVTMMFCVRIVSGEKIPFIVYVLILFLVVMIALYCLFPGSYTFWKSVLLSSKATDSSISILNILEGINRIYKELSSVTSGRGIILFLLSLMAWIVELGSVIIASGLTNRNVLNDCISHYLLSALGVGYSLELKRFVIISVIVLIVVYIVLKVFDIIRIKKVRP